MVVIIVVIIKTIIIIIIIISAVGVATGIVLRSINEHVRYGCTKQTVID